MWARGLCFVLLFFFSRFLTSSSELGSGFNENYLFVCRCIFLTSISKGKLHFLRAKLCHREIRWLLLRSRALKSVSVFVMTLGSRKWLVCIEIWVGIYFNQFYFPSNNFISELYKKSICSRKSHAFQDNFIAYSWRGNIYLKKKMSRIANPSVFEGRSWYRIHEIQFFILLGFVLHARLAVRQAACWLLLLVFFPLIPARVFFPSIFHNKCTAPISPMLVTREKNGKKIMLETIYLFLIFFIYNLDKLTLNRLPRTIVSCRIQHDDGAVTLVSVATLKSQR